MDEDGRKPQSEAFLLSRLLGRTVVTDQDHVLGRLRDLIVDLELDSPAVTAVVVGHGRRGSSVLPWQDVVELPPSGPVRVRQPEDRPDDCRAGRAGDRTRDTEIRLARDVLDTQVVDLGSFRLSRVSDLVLTVDRDGSVVVAAADVGVAAVLRRMGLDWLARPLGPVIVDWHVLHLTSPRGHQVQLTAEAAAFRRLDPRGLAELLTRLSTEGATEVIATLPAPHVTAALHLSHHGARQRLVRALPPAETERLIGAAHPEHAAWLSELRSHRGTVPGRRLRRTAGWRRNGPPPASPRPSPGEQA
jgi:sporulation protein YlmC with PRC-barrel domain